MPGFANETSVGGSHEWSTPPELFDSLDEEFGPFTCDPACRGQEHSAIVVKKRGGLVCVPPGAPSPEGAGFALKVDGLISDWAGKVYLNPPYGRNELRAWVPKAVSEVEKGNVGRVVALLPARTDTKVWQEYVFRGMLEQEHHDAIDAHPLLRGIRFLPGRLKFSGHRDPAKFPSAVVVWER